MKVTYYSARDENGKLTGMMLADVSVKNEKIMDAMIEELEGNGYKCVLCPNDEDGVYSDSFGLWPSEKKEFQTAYLQAKKHVTKLIKEGKL